jgi:hypothetical protein
MIEAWESGKFITYPALPGFRGPWSMLLPEGYEGLTHQPVDVCAAFQWREATRIALDDLDDVPSSQLCVVRYEDLVRKPAEVVRGIATMAELDLEDVVRFASTEELPISTHTLSTPRADKWRRHEARMAPFLPELEKLFDKAIAWSRARADRQ